MLEQIRYSTWPHFIAEKVPVSGALENLRRVTQGAVRLQTSFIRRLRECL